tara:strand:+ start:448 stop:1257 length:810 start_codon:yes stop_codon:yes gene_type:complete
MGTAPEIKASVYTGDSLHTPNTNRTLKTTRHKIGTTGTLTSLQVEIISGTPTRNLYTRVVLEDEYNRERGLLFRGYCDPQNEPYGAGGIPVNLDWKFRLDSRCSMASAPTLRLMGTILTTKQEAGGWNGTNESSLSGQGNIRTIDGTDPATGAEITEAVPTYARWKPISIKFPLDVGSADVSPAIQLTDGSNIINQTDRLTASAGGGYGNVVGFGNGFQSHVGTVGSAIFYTFNEVILPSGYQIKTSNVSGDDEYGSPRLSVEEWIEDQ